MKIEKRKDQKVSQKKHNNCEFTIYVRLYICVNVLVCAWKLCNIENDSNYQIYMFHVSHLPLIAMNQHFMDCFYATNREKRSKVSKSEMCYGMLRRLLRNQKMENNIENK